MIIKILYHNHNIDVISTSTQIYSAVETFHLFFSVSMHGIIHTSFIFEKEKST
jgi:hypothetical protein